LENSQILSFSVDYNSKGDRIDVYLSRKLPRFSRTFISKLIEDGNLMLNASQIVDKPSLKLKGGEFFELEIPPAKKLDIEPEKIDLNIVFEDNNIIVINKACGMVVHPVGEVVTGTLVNALLEHCDNLTQIGGVERPGIVHRLDKQTTGVMVVAKNDFSHKWISDQFRQRLTDKKYYAIVKGVIKEKEFRIDAPIGRHHTQRHKMAVVRNGRDSATIVTVVESFKNHTLVACKILTGRTHQIRVHLQHKGFPILGDKTYGGKWTEIDEIINRVALHAFSLSFFHPVSGKNVKFEAEPPKDFQEMLDYLRKNML